MRSIVYVLCPGKAVTGGPEALHQFTFIARQLGYDCRLVYYPQEHSTPQPYLKYPLRKCSKLPKDARLIVVPEVFLQLEELPIEATKIIWWLSWDNARIIDPSFFSAPDRIHLFQSEYAYKRSAALQKGLPRGLILGDYLSLEHMRTPMKESRKDLIFYNPVKGYYWTRQLMERNPDLHWVPLKGLNPKQLADLLKTGKIYIDFGHSPGKDRMPREAACANLCVITSKQGAFGHKEDTPIDDRYQFDLPKQLFDDPTRIVTEEEELILKKISLALRDCLANYPKRLQDFKFYRETILNQSKLFAEQIDALMRLVDAKRLNWIEHTFDYLWFFILRLGRKIEKSVYVLKRLFFKRKVN